MTKILSHKPTCIISVGTLRQEYHLLQDKDEGAQERQSRTTGPDPRGKVPNLRGPDLGLYKGKPDLQEAWVIEPAKGPGPSTLFG